MESTHSPSDMPLEEAETTTQPARGLWAETLARLLRKPSALMGLFILGTLVIIAIFAPLIATHDPEAVLLDIPEEGAEKRMDPCVHLLGCPKAGEDLVRITTDDPIAIAAISSTNSLISGAAGNTAWIWNIDEGHEVGVFEYDTPFRAMAWNQNDQKILTANGEEILVWDMNTRKIARSLTHEGGADQILWTQDGLRFLTADQDKVILWDGSMWTQSAVIELEAPLVATQWKDSVLVMITSGNNVEFWNAFSAFSPFEVLEHDAPVTAVTFNKARNRLLTISAGQLRVWDTSTYEMLRQIEYEGELTNAAWHENVARDVCNVMASNGNTALVWDMETGDLLFELDHGEPITKIAGSPLATRIYTQSDTMIRLWDADTGDEVFTISFDAPISGSAWLSTGGAIFNTSANVVRLTKTSNYQYIMGIDGNVRDQFSRVIYGTRVSLMVGLTAVTFAILLGTISGAVAGYLGGWVDNVIMRVMDVLLAFPALILAIAVVTMLGPGLQNALLAISVVFIPAYARVARAGVLTVREEDFVLADHALGVANWRILFRRILPNALAPLIVQATLGIGTAILDAAALSFLGLGAQPPMAEWGAMLGAERNQIFTAPHLVFYPGIAIMIIVLAFNLLGDGLRDALDPRLDR
ncbi:MAG: ABC transporter permease subunit [Anaerolineae bacterium]|nr:ABC transporter permease subunit [Anaerolineae bacterium]